MAKASTTRERDTKFSSNPPSRLSAETARESTVDHRTEAVAKRISPEYAALEGIDGAPDRQGEGG